MHIYSTHVSRYLVEISYDGENAPCMLRIENVAIGSGIVLCDDVFPNPLVLSATLRDTLGLSVAIEALHGMCISPNSRLWDLNHSNPYSAIPVIMEHCDVVPDVGPDYDFLGQTDWITYDDYSVSYLFQNRVTMQLFEVERIPSRMVDELKPVSYAWWLSIVDTNNEREPAERVDWG